MSNDASTAPRMKNPPWKLRNSRNERTKAAENGEWPHHAALEKRGGLHQQLKAAEQMENDRSEIPSGRVKRSRTMKDGWAAKAGWSKQTAGLG